MRWNRAVTSATIPSTEAWSVTSRRLGLVMDRRPSSAASAATAAASSGLTSATATSAPFLARARTMPLPMPRPPPVTTAILPVTSICGS